MTQTQASKLVVARGEVDRGMGEMGFFLIDTGAHILDIHNSSQQKCI